jgi:hypothetical protein
MRDKRDRLEDGAMRKAILALAALAVVCACDTSERGTKITYYENFVQIRMEDRAAATHICAFGMATRECDEALGKFLNSSKWLDQARADIAKLDPPMTDAERNEVHDYVMHFANAGRPDYAPMFTEKDYVP